MVKAKKPSAAQLFVLVKATKQNGCLDWSDRGAGGTRITDATIRALVDAGWGVARFWRSSGRWGWISFDISELGRAVSRAEVDRLDVKDRERAARNIALDDAPAGAKGGA